MHCTYQASTDCLTAKCTNPGWQQQGLHTHIYDKVLFAAERCLPFLNSEPKKKKKKEEEEEEEDLPQSIAVINTYSMEQSPS